MQYDYYEYKDDLGTVLQFKFLKSDPKISEQKLSFIKMLRQAAEDLAKELTI